MKTKLNLKSQWVDCPICNVRMNKKRQFQAGWECKLCKSTFFLKLPLTKGAITALLERADGLG